MISKKLIVFTLWVGIMAYLLSTRLRTGVCPNVKTMQNFSTGKYMGKWYEIARYPMIWETGLKCVTATYSLNPEGTVNVVNAGILKYVNYKMTAKALATPSKTETSKLLVKCLGFFQSLGKRNYWVIDTDYTSYSLVYSCTDIPVPKFPIRFENAWILSRKPTLDEKRITSLTKTLTEMKSNSKAMFKTDQKNCPKN